MTDRAADRLDLHVSRTSKCLGRALGPVGTRLALSHRDPKRRRVLRQHRGLFCTGESTAVGQEWSFDYRLDFLLNSSPAPPGGKAVSTRTGASGTGRLDSSKRKFVVDFASEALASLNPEAKVEPVLSASSGRIIKPEMYKNLINRSWRLVFEFAPDPKQHPVEFRAKLGNQVLTETWLYQWSLPS